MKMWPFSKKKPKPCRCHGCTGDPQKRPHNPNVSESLDMWVDEDDTLHWRVKSSYRSLY